MIDGFYRSRINDIELAGRRGRDEKRIRHCTLLDLRIHVRDDADALIGLSLKIGKRECDIALDLGIVIERHEDVRSVVTYCRDRSARVRKIDRRWWRPSLAAIRRWGDRMLWELPALQPPDEGDPSRRTRWNDRRLISDFSAVPHAPPVNNAPALVEYEQDRIFPVHLVIRGKADPAVGKEYRNRFRQMRHIQEG